MSHPRFFRLSALLALITAGFAAEKKPYDASVVWSLTSPALVGGHATTVLGSPAMSSKDEPTALYFNGVSDGVFVPINPLAEATEFTIEVLFKPASDGLAEQRFFHLQDEAGNRTLLEIRLTNGKWALDTFLYSVESTQKLALLDRTKTHPSDQWTWVACTYSNGRLTHYINGEKELEGDVFFPPTHAGVVSLGVRQNKVYWFKGGMREVRFHRTALAPAQLQRAASR